MGTTVKTTKKRLDPVDTTEIRVVVGDKVRVVLVGQTKAWELGNEKDFVVTDDPPLAAAVQLAADKRWAATEFLEVGQLSRAEIARMLKGEGG